MPAPAGQFELGARIDPGTRDRLSEPVHLRASDLTTHGVIVGMTGSGKTGLGIVMIEEALLAGIPVLAIDPKGDLGNLLLTFPDLRAADFEPWVSPGDAERKGLSVADYAGQQAEKWRSGLESWGLGPERIRALRERADLVIYTPGSTAGVPLDVVGSLAPPAGSVDAEARADEVEGLVTSLLGLVGIEADPISSREHILLSTLIGHAWDHGQTLDLPSLVLRVTDPPLRKLGVFEIDTFFPAKDRTALAMRLNGLIASPSFASWTQGPALDPASLLIAPDGRPRAAVVTLAHLSDAERQFVVTLLLSRMITWMRAQSGTGDLRTLVYMDEVFGFVPPTAAPPSKKPILTLLKQARAFGVGMVLSTQNPVDLDYKALSNAGTWMIGRLQTERDKARLVDGLRSAAGSVDIGALETTISGLGGREFVLHTTRGNPPELFTTRWALSYLRGPLTRDQIQTLMRERPEKHADSTTPSRGAPPPPSDTVAAAPPVAAGIPVYYLDPAAPWAGQVGARSGSARYEPAVVARVQLLFDETKADLRHQEEWEAVFFPLAPTLDPAEATHVDYDARDLRSEPPASGVGHVPTGAPLAERRYFTDLESALKEHLYRNQSVEVFANRSLKLFSRIGESRSDFEARCRGAAEDAEDADAAKIRDRFEDRMERVRQGLAKAQDRVEELEEASRQRKGQELLSGVGSVLTAFLGGRRTASKIATEIRRASSRRGSSSAAAQRLDSAQNRLDEKGAELERLEGELADQLLEIDERWNQRAADIEVIHVGLEKSDINVAEIAVVWVPR
ncbi:MAG: DUF87 domain-containing protein [Gemmatimonadota bacterium]